MGNIIIIVMIEQHVSEDFRHTICGPFDLQFRKKFLGKKSTSLATEKLRLLKAHDVQNQKLRVFSQQNLLPRIKELQKIAKDSKTVKSKKLKINKYVDGISELELYIAKKLMHNQSTKQIVAKMSKDAFKVKLSSTYTSNLGRQNLAKTHDKFYEAQYQSQSMMKANKTAYNSQRKWVSDRQFNEKFEKFIIVRNNSESYSMKKVFGDEQRQSQETMIHQLTHDKQVLQHIVKKMIQDQNYQTQMEGQQKFNAPKESIGEYKEKGEKNINWILQSCEDFQTRFKIKKQKSKKLLKQK